MDCLKCGAPNRPKAKFCTNCGVLLGNLCPSCGKDNKPEAQFCVACGTKLSDASELARLVALAKREDQTAIARLYEMTKRRYMGICRQILAKTRTTGDMEDALQDAYVKIFAGLDSLQDPDLFVGWGARIVTNTALDLVRKKTPVLLEEESDLDAAGYEPVHVSAASAMDPGQMMDERETSRLVAEMVDSLSEQQRLCIYLFYMQEMSVKDIAAQLNVSENTVKSRLKYGRDNIEKKVLLLEKQGTKLYGLAPMPFFVWLLGRSMASSEASLAVSAAVKAGVLGRVLPEGARAAAGTGARTAGRTGARAAGSTGARAAAGTGAKTGVRAGAKTGIKAVIKNAAKTAGGKAAAAVGAGGKAAGSALAVKAVAGAAAAAVAIGGTGAAIRAVSRNHVTKEMKAYASLLEDEAAKAGNAKIVNDTSEDDDLYLEGLCAAGLVDFNQDGNDDLVTVHSTGALNGSSIMDDEEPAADGYTIGIWSYEKGKSVLLLETDTVGEYQTYVSGYGSLNVDEAYRNNWEWTETATGLAIVEDRSGKNCLWLFDQDAGLEHGFSIRQIYAGQEDGLVPAPEMEAAPGPAPEIEAAPEPAPEMEAAPEPASEMEAAPGPAPEMEAAQPAYEHIYHWDGAFYRDGVEIDEAAWRRAVTPARVLYAATLSGDYNWKESFADTSWGDIGYAGVRTTALQPEELLQILKGKEKKPEQKRAEWEEIYLDILMECNFRNHLYELYPAQGVRGDVTAERPLALTPAEVDELREGGLAGSAFDERVMEICRQVYDAMLAEGKNVSFDDSTGVITGRYDLSDDDIDAYEIDLKNEGSSLPDLTYIYEYGLHDMNGDSVPELFICNRTSEAGATCCVYTIVDHQLAFCGDLDYSHTSFMIGDGEGILSTWGHMGKSSQGVIKMPDDLSGDWIRETVDASEAEKQYPYMLWTYRTEDLYPLWSSSLE